MMAQGCVFVHLLLLCVWCIDIKFQGVNAQNVTISKVQPIDDPEEGGTLDLRCNVTNLEPSDFIEWSRLYMNNKVIIRPNLDTTKYTLYTESSSEQSLVERLKINVLDRDDAGTYSCTVKHSEGTVVETSSIYLTVRYLPAAEYPLCSPDGYFTVQEGTPQQFTCVTGVGSPAVSMLIRKNGADIPFESLVRNYTTFTRLHTFTFAENDTGTSVECEIISLPFQRSCTFGPITVTMQDNRENQLPTTVENNPTPQIDGTGEGLDTSYPTWTETTSGSSQRTPHSTNLRPETVNLTTPRPETVNLTTPSPETVNPTTSSQETSNISTPSQETSKPSTPSQETPNLPVVGLPIVLIAVIVGVSICVFLLILLILVVYCCFKKKPKSRQPQINLPLFQPTTDLVFEPQGSNHAIHQESTNLDKVDMTEKDDTSEEFGADRNSQPEVMLVSHSPNPEPEDTRSTSFKNGTDPSPTDVDKKNIKTFTPQPELTPDTGDSKEGQEEPHKSTPTTGEIVYSEVSSQQRVPQVSSVYTTYADLDLPPCTSDTVPLPQDQTFYAQISHL